MEHAGFPASVTSNTVQSRLEMPPRAEPTALCEPEMAMK